ncbi:hypothetical protein [Pedosphaera parvula]|uniref:Uncharacterized protein n=1 Tax=Pedosphaera parvula (strain Ellin514) TaxID=320771 RepID=B9XT19_PEDPL|nr:hypothetical protein [Pedosphaera parvula]EEF57009.1 hypothetical protein Cflav_PD0038 [Pedosphaera parvula Ellin514]
MIFQVHVAVLLAVPEPWSDLPGSENDWHGAVSYFFGINATDPAEAVRMTVDAARNAVGREGEFIGGVIIEMHCQRVDATEFDESRKYFHQPIDQPGIFYVTGTTSIQLSRKRISEALAELESVKEKIRQSGLPTPSFIHPKLPEEPPRKVRLLCDICNHWVETDTLDLMESFMGISLTFVCEQREKWKSRRGTFGSFVNHHISRCFEGGQPGISGITAIHENDPRWATLNEANREEDDGA